MALVLEALGSDQTLDLGSLGVGGLALTLGLDLSSDDVLADLRSPSGLVFHHLYIFILYPWTAGPAPNLPLRLRGVGSRGEGGKGQAVPLTLYPVWRTLHRRPG